MKQKIGWIITRESEENGRYWFEAKYYEKGVGTYKGKKLVRPIAEYGVYCKWDGCMELYIYGNGDDSGSEENTEVIHICNQDDICKVLGELKKIRIEKGQEL